MPGVGRFHQAYVKIIIAKIIKKKTLGETNYSVSKRVLPILRKETLVYVPFVFFLSNSFHWSVENTAANDNYSV